ncbi:Proteolipid membrane putative modulator family protein [Clavispora lusitaniae]|uniref:Proteolipid membrane putative modulator family protein n=1 Tax=Clavispora lusitaniae TaxID=36911 RepID=UPI00202BFA08|nr:Proteolipid membrane putative modulator family protein [Clavispora lusitaniae]
MVCADIIKIIFAIILPPLGVFLEVGCSGAFFLNIILTILGYIPGIIHAEILIKDNQKFVYPEEMPHFASYRMSTLRRHEFISTTEV